MASLKCSYCVYFVGMDIETLQIDAVGRTSSGHKKNFKVGISWNPKDGNLICSGEGNQYVLQLVSVTPSARHQYNKTGEQLQLRKCIYLVANLHTDP